ncbi:MAG: response regulator [Sedimentisphaerales bacterium]|nr:response regulator [Sedimentisphaerales bacterium]
MEATVLLVDDEPMVTNSLERLLHQYNYNTIVANSALKAIDIISKKPVDIIVTDEKMPLMTGNEFLVKLRTEYPRILRVMLTGNPDSATARKAIKDGDVYRFLCKPCNGVDVVTTIRQGLIYNKVLEKLTVARHICLKQAEALHQYMELGTIHPDTLKCATMDDLAFSDIAAFLDQIDEDITKSELLFTFLKAKSEVLSSE